MGRRMKSFAINVVKQAHQRFIGDVHCNGMARFIVDQFVNKYQNAWNCVTKQMIDYDYSIHKTSFIHLSIGHLVITIWKSD